MRFTTLTPVLAAAVMALTPRPSDACGAAQPRNLTFVGSTPSDGAVDVPRDLGLVLEVKAWPEYPLEVASPTVSVHVLEAVTGVEIAGTQNIWNSEAPRYIWRPLQPLAPQTKYVVHGFIVSSDPPPSSVGPRVLDVQFGTGAALAAPVTLDGRITVDLQAGELPKCDAPCQPCTACAPCGINDAIPIVTARVRIPAVVGGYEAAGYEGWVYLTDDTPATFNGPGEALSGGTNVKMPSYQIIAPGQPTVATLVVPDEASTYHPCFSVNIWDAAGHTVTPPALCLAAMTPSETIANREQKRDEPTAACAAARDSDSHPSNLWVFAFALAIVARRIVRRRSVLPYPARDPCWRTSFR